LSGSFLFVETGDRKQETGKIENHRRKGFGFTYFLSPVSCLYYI